MRKALEPGRLRRVYDHVAGHYDFQHALLTGKSDQRGRELLVEHAVRSGDRVLDCGAGTGSTGLLAARKAGPDGKVVMIDASDGMLAVARDKVAQAGLQQQVEIRTGDMLDLPFDDNSFDVVLSTYSLCPIYDPAKGAKELYRVARPGGRIGIAHSTDPHNPLVKRLADKVEDIAWRMPSLSLGCRSVSVLPELESLGCRILFEKFIGVPLWPFLVFVAEKPLS
jgi:demethylmenaquinone methyltransferase / 2-methoxy-6-polyprenyl-1,4-benzoquinol methylase